MKRALVVLSFALASILHVGCATVQRISLDCAVELGADVLTDVSAAMDKSELSIEAIIGRYTLDAVKCAVSHYLADEKGQASIGPNVREANGRAFLAAHP